LLPELQRFSLDESNHALLAAQQLDAVRALLMVADRRFGRPLVAGMDWLSEHWALDRDVPFRDEISQIAKLLGRRGAWFANLNYEWGCSAGVIATREPLLVRVLDWPFKQMGKLAVVVDCRGPAGAWRHVTWPGCVGVLQGMAPGRFAAAINQAPRRSFGLGPYAGYVTGWVAARLDCWRSRGIPPLLLLRQVMDTAPDYATALQRLAASAVSVPVIFTLVGTREGEYAVVQKSLAGTVVRQATAVTNCWLDGHLPGDLGMNHAPLRLAKLQESLSAGDNFRWLQPPVLNHESRLAVEMCPATGLFRARGYEDIQPVTVLLDEC